MSASLLVELFTEELPPKALSSLGVSFSGGLRDELVAAGFAPAASVAKSFATPRRLAVLIPGVLAESPGRKETKKLMPAKVAFDAAGQPTAALQKRLEKEGVSPADAASQIERRTDAGVENVYLNLAIAGVALAQGLQAALEKTLAKLPIPKVMGYQLDDGTTTVSFVRPAHGLVALHGAAVVPIRILGIDAGRITHGHRFQGVRNIEVAAADAYEEALRAHGKVIASFEERKAEIERQLGVKAKALGATLGPAESVAPLLDEVTALVEFPTVYVGEFEGEFLAVPQECLILTMRANQKYFPLFDAAGKLTNRFLIVSNMELQDPKNIVEGNQRVVRPRLADARFFFETDKKLKLAERVPQLAAIVFHNKLGSQLERVRRIELIAEFIAAKLGANVAHAREAAQLAKADLGSNMVGEFPELQGLMGGYYAEHEGRPKAVAQAIKDQYLLRANDIGNPDNLVSACLYLADRVELLTGMFGIGNLPTGDKDPFALRRAALGAISVFEQLGAAGRPGATLTLAELLAFARETFPAGLVAEATDAAVLAFVYERYRNQLVTTFDRAAVDAVVALTPPLHEVVARVKAVIAFGALPEAPALAAANKRIRNILKKADGTRGTIDAALLAEPAEQALHAALLAQEPQVEASFARQDYAGALKSLAGMREAVDAFFDKVMVNAEDPALRANRLALLAQLEPLMNRVADISMLSA
jgi:glycyl-tRNA synthetase beta chain